MVAIHKYKKWKYSGIKTVITYIARAESIVMVKNNANQRKWLMRMALTVIKYMYLNKPHL